MNPILIIRAEIVCLVILIFIALYSRFYDMGKDNGTFMRICIFAIGHIAFDLITVITVNNADVVPGFVNKICHIIFYMFALLFSYEFLCYTVSICYPKRTLRRMRYICIAPIIIYLVIVPFLPMVYLDGNGTKYSFGEAAIVGYGVAMLLFISSIFIVIKNLKKLDKNVVGAILPMLGTAVVAEIIQILVPEMLFTGGTVTIIAVGFFFSLENPVAVMRKKVLIDAMTGVESRHSYEADILQMDREFASGEQYGMAFFDINDLKAVNDMKGHLVGDDYIGCIAQILMKCLKSAEKIYRMGGDEFLAVYHNKDTGLIHDELKDVEAECEKKSQESDYRISVAVGCAVSSGQYKSLRDVLRMADFRMYANKTKTKQRRSYLLNNSDELNIAGLTDRIFDAFAIADFNRFLFVTNLSTNVTRWSLSAAEYLGLDSVFIYDCKNLILKQIHPDDRNLFLGDIRTIATRNQENFSNEYRVLNANNEYVTCVCSGTLLLGKSGDPDLFAGTLMICEASESIDKITGLRNSREMVNHFNYLISNHTPAAIIKLSITNLSRINMLYGYVSGNEILKQFSEIMRMLVGNDGNVFCADGSKFVITLPGFTKEQTIEIYRKIRHASEQQIHLDTISPPLKLAAGAYIVSEKFEGTASFLQSNLIFAYDQSRYSERGKLVFFDDQSNTFIDSDSKNQLLAIHHDAISGCEGFYLVYQPILSAQSGKIIGAEALLRWKNTIFGVVSPNNFIPWLEGDPCFPALGEWILKCALTDAKEILSYLPDFVINVNVSIQQLEHEKFADAVLELLKETGFPASQLCLELTERCREMKTESLKAQVDLFRSNGIRVALDDIGTGFSSFGLLLSLNVDEIKLDQSFVKEIRTKRANQILTKMLIDASNSLGYSTCLEGVENDELCEYLKSYGATFYQGYYCNKPIPPDEFMNFIQMWNSDK